jgi:hypothetical protein
VIVGVCGAAGGLSLIWFQRYGLVRFILLCHRLRLTFVLALRMRLYRDLPRRPRHRPHNDETGRYECRSTVPLRP